MLLNCLKKLNVDCVWTEGQWAAALCVHNTCFWGLSVALGASPELKEVETTAFLHNKQNSCVNRQLRILLHFVVFTIIQVVLVLCCSEAGML